jgi:RNA polymerase sigma-70 factor (sigma-E family)
VTEDLTHELSTFIDARYVHLRRTAYLLCGDWHRAEDLVQTALARVVVAARRRRVDSLDAYTRRTLLRVYLDDSAKVRWRREKSWPDLAETAVPQGDRDVALTVLAALKQLPARQRAVVVLRYWEDRSVEETAEALGVTPGTVKSQSAKAVVTLRQLLADLPEMTSMSGGAQ